MLCDVALGNMYERTKADFIGQFYSAMYNLQKVWHPELTRVRSIWFLLFEIKCVLVYNSTLFKLTDLFIILFLLRFLLVHLS